MPPKKRTARSTSKPVAAAASRVLRNPMSTPDEKAVAASALSQSEPTILIDSSTGRDETFVHAELVPPGEETAMGKRGPRPARERAVDALEQAGMDDAAAVVREATGLPPKPRTPQQDFIFSVRDTVDKRIGTVGFPCADIAELQERESILRGLRPPAGYRYKATRKSETYLEVVLTGE